MKRLVALCASAALLAGCWTARQGAVSVADFPNQGVRTIAILPVLNQSEAPTAPAAAYASLARELASQKKYVVLPMAKVTATLRTGGGAGVFTQAMSRLNAGQPISDEQFAAMAKALEADALFLASVVSFHQTGEEGVGVSPQGGTYAQQFPVSVVQVRGLLWGGRSRQRLWEDEAMTRAYTQPGRPDIATVMDMATRDLLTSFPENTWAPAD